MAKLAQWLSSVLIIYLYGAFECIFFIMWHTPFRVNTHSIAAWMSRNSLLETDVISELKFKWLQWEPNPQLPTISFIIFWDFSMFFQIFLSPQVKRWAIITYKHGIYELPHELPNDFRKLGNIRKVSKHHRMIA